MCRGFLGLPGHACVHIMNIHINILRLRLGLRFISIKIKSGRWYTSPVLFGSLKPPDEENEEEKGPMPELRFRFNIFTIAGTTCNVEKFVDILKDPQTINTVVVQVLGFIVVICIITTISIYLF